MKNKTECDRAISMSNELLDDRINLNKFGVFTKMIEHQHIQL